MLERMGLEALAAAFDPDREARVEEEPAPGDLVSEFCDQYSPFFRLPGRAGNAASMGAVGQPIIAESRFSTSFSGNSCSSNMSYFGTLLLDCSQR